MNTAMTFGLHRHWRDKALVAAVSVLLDSKKASVDSQWAPVNVLDVAT